MADLALVTWRMAIDEARAGKPDRLTDLIRALPTSKVPISKEIARELAGYVHDPTPRSRRVGILSSEEVSHIRAIFHALMDQGLGSARDARARLARQYKVSVGTIRNVVEYRNAYRRHATKTPKP